MSWGISGPWWILSAIVLSNLVRAQLYISSEKGETTLWYNSSSSQTATYLFNCYDFEPFLQSKQSIQKASRYARGASWVDPTVYLCVTSTYWGKNCKSWGAVGWNTGDEWGYKPSEASKSKDKDGKPLQTRLYLFRRLGICNYGINIENPMPGDAGTYVLGLWWRSGLGYYHTTLHLKDMFHNPQYTKLMATVTTTLINPLIQHIQAFKNMMAISNPTYEDVMAIETGSSEVNLWLEWMRYNAQSHNMSDCYVCAHGRPHMGTVPLNIPLDKEKCFFSLYNNTHTNDTSCEGWKKKYPLLSKNPEPGNTITPYPGNYTCYISTQQNASNNYGKFPPGYCSENRIAPVGNHTRSLGDIYWLCGDMKLRVKLESTWKGECALAQIIMPLHMFPEHRLVGTQPDSGLSRTKRDSTPGGSLDPHVYIDSIGVPRGVPNEFKARDQVAAGFESLFPQVTINKNVDWINYIYYNQQRFVNYTRDALQGVAEQLGATSQMTYQDRMALDMMLAEKGGTCIYIGKIEGCCTYIPNLTGPNGKVTTAINKLKDLSEELKRNSGITNPWDQYFGWLTNWKQALIQICVILLIVLVIFAIVVFCVLPCCKKMAAKGVDQILYQTLQKTETPEHYAAYLEAYRANQTPTKKTDNRNHII